MARKPGAATTALANARAFQVKSLGEGSMGSVSLVRRKCSDPNLLGSFKNKGQGRKDSDASFSDIGKERRKSQSKDGAGLFAMKAIHLNRMTEEFIRELNNEIDILKRLDHPNIVKP